MIMEAIRRVANQESLSLLDAEQVMLEIMHGNATPAQIGALLLGMRVRKETPEEIGGFAKAMLNSAAEIPHNQSMVVDTCGTGGDEAHTFNISTTAAFIVAGAGIPVAKHGNVSVSSSCGSADVLENLGVNINLSAAEMGRCLDQAGITFLFAPRIHKAMRHAAAVRRELKVRTALNILGPLTNPVQPRAQVVGVFDAEAAQLVAKTLSLLNVDKAYVVHGAGGLDEISLAGPSLIWEVQGSTVRYMQIDPQDFGMCRAANSALSGGTPSENAEHLKSILLGEKGAKRNAVLLNAALAIKAARKAANMNEALQMAALAIDSGAAAAKLEALIAFNKHKRNTKVC